MKLKLVFSRIEKVLLNIAIFLFLSLVLIMSCDALGRYIFNNPIIGAYDLVVLYIFPAIFYFALSYSYKEKAHIKIDFLLLKLNKKTQLFLNKASVLTTCIVSFLIFWKLGQRFMASYSINEIYIGAYNWPVYIGYFIAVLGFLFLFLRTLFELFEPENVSRSEK